MHLHCPKLQCWVNEGAAEAAGAASSHAGHEKTRAVPAHARGLGLHTGSLADRKRWGENRNSGKEFSVRERRW